ncbi:MAG: gamma-glutamyltranspeptidase [Frankiales bacterium]|nr:gamma-glutamyltranspeptidase [Frankiales bacterium]
MTAPLAPVHTSYAPTAMVSTVDTLATEAGLAALRRGGSAVDAAIAANGVLTVTLPSQCGLGGDLFAIVQRRGEAPELLVAAGRAGSGADAGALRAQGHLNMPRDADVRSVTVPGCVDGWLALHRRYARLDLAELLAPAVRYAAEGFTASAYLAEAVTRRAATSPDAAAMTTGGHLRAGDLVRRPGAARVLAAIGKHGRRGFYEGEFGSGLMALGNGLFTDDDLRTDQAEWMTPLSLDVWGARLWTAAPPSQGYITLGAAWLAEQAGLGSDPEDPRWPHLLIEAIRQASHDRPEVLFEGADGARLIHQERLRPRCAGISPDRVADLSDSYRRGGTTYLCAVDADGTVVSLIQSNCMSFGSGLVAGETGIWLHNRGIGFSLVPGHPGEYQAGRRPAHTLAPALVTNEAGEFRAVLGTRGGDSQPQIVLQLIARLLGAGQDPATALAAGRWVLRGTGDETSFDTWGFQGRVRVALEGQAPAAWAEGLRSRGHEVRMEAPFAHPFGHAQLIVSDGSRLAGAADPRSDSAAVGGY